MSSDMTKAELAVCRHELLREVAALRQERARLRQTISWQQKTIERLSAGRPRRGTRTA